MPVSKVRDGVSWQSSSSPNSSPTVRGFRRQWTAFVVPTENPSNVSTRSTGSPAIVVGRQQLLSVSDGGGYDESDAQVDPLLLR